MRPNQVCRKSVGQHFEKLRNVSDDAADTKGTLHKSMKGAINVARSKRVRIRSASLSALCALPIISECRLGPYRQQNRSFSWAVSLETAEGHL
jgi:hypothetical protein